MSRANTTWLEDLLAIAGEDEQLATAETTFSKNAADADRTIARLTKQQTELASELAVDADSAGDAKRLQADPRARFALGPARSAAAERVDLRARLAARKRYHAASSALSQAKRTRAALFAALKAARLDFVSRHMGN